MVSSIFLGISTEFEILVRNSDWGNYIAEMKEKNNTKEKKRKRKITHLPWRWQKLSPPWGRRSWAAAPGCWMESRSPKWWTGQTEETARGKAVNLHTGCCASVCYSCNPCKSTVGKQLRTELAKAREKRKYDLNWYKLCLLEDVVEAHR